MREGLVVGLDLSTGREVHAEDRPIFEWRAKGHNGDRTLVCLYCHLGLEVPQPTLVPLVPKGRMGGKRRHHFAHPPGLAPQGGHNPETLWHSAGKHAVFRWARQQPGVVEAQLEQWTSQRQRRADVLVRFLDGRWVAVEIQRVRITDAEWLARHHDYQRAGIVDVWLWHPEVGVPQIVIASEVPGWILNDSHTKVTALLGAAHSHDNITDPAHHARHWPACRNDTRVFEQCNLNQMRLDPTGLQIPDTLAEAIAGEAAAAKSRRRRLRDAAQRAATAVRRLPTAPRNEKPAPPIGSTQGPATTPAARHELYRIDSLPPHVDPNGRDRYWCSTCQTTLTGADLAQHAGYHTVQR